MSNEKDYRIREIIEKIGVDALKHYDIKREMFYLFDKTTKRGASFKLSTFWTTPLIESLESAEMLKRILSLDYNEIDADMKIKRYLLFKLQAKNNCGFDCDHLSTVFYKYRFVDQLWTEFFEISTEHCKDTVFSMQSLWGKTINALEFSDDSANHGGDYSWQYRNLDLIKEKMGEKLYNAFAEFSYYYHTIGNVVPCPPKFNIAKYAGGVYFDRLDLFLKVNRRWDDFFCEENIRKFHLEPFLYDKELSKWDESYLNEAIERINDGGKETLVSYIEHVISLINNRGALLIDVIKNLNKY